jgi:hypothetical protein
VIAPPELILWGWVKIESGASNVIVRALAERTNPDAATPTASASRDAARGALHCNDSLFILSLLFMICFFSYTPPSPGNFSNPKLEKSFSTDVPLQPCAEMPWPLRLDHTLCGSLAVIPISPKIVYRSSYLCAAGPQNRKISVQRPVCRALLSRDRRLSVSVVRENSLRMPIISLRRRDFRNRSGGNIQCPDYHDAIELVICLSFWVSVSRVEMGQIWHSSISLTSVGMSTP